MHKLALLLAIAVLVASCSNSGQSLEVTGGTLALEDQLAETDASATTAEGEASLEQATAVTSTSVPTTSVPVTSKTLQPPDGETYLPLTDRLTDDQRSRLTPEELAFLSITPADGVCAMFDATLDMAFAEESDSGSDSESDLDDLLSEEEGMLHMMSFNDGPFGAAWSELAGQFAAAESGDGPEVEYDQVKMDAMDQLATEQCGYPIIFVLGYSARTCFKSVSSVIGEDPPAETTTTVEPVCRYRLDPRPQLLAGVTPDELIYGN